MNRQRGMPLPIRVASAFVLAAAFGCPASSDKPEADESPPPTAAGTPPSDLLGAEFQRPPALPAVEPLPKLKDAGQPSAADQTLPASKESPVSKPPAGKESGAPFDPIKENGPIFVDWPKPRLAIVVTGMEDGYLEPCGCAGLDRMRGGMSRRH
ncbi:MAG: hypothetical protein JW959_13190, partial [Pirellulales bacterium]|nr:hypothetical protein [Pirellulales bacterium]